jgi:hypothetical protein
MERFKKGQLVPKRLNMCEVKKSRYRSTVVFGADVEVEGRRIKVLSDGPAICWKRDFIKRRKNGPKETVHLHVHDICVEPYDV